MGSIFLQPEMLSRLNISIQQLNQWESHKLIRSSGLTEDKIPFYTNETFEQCNNILKLTELGYSNEEIIKILKSEFE